MPRKAGRRVTFTMSSNQVPKIGSHELAHRLEDFEDRRMKYLRRSGMHTNSVFLYIIKAMCEGIFDGVAAFEQEIPEEWKKKDS